MSGHLYNKNVVKVIPEKAGVVHRNYSDLTAIRGHKYYFVNLLSGKITYKTSKVRLPTGCNTIMAAKLKVEEHLKMLAGGDSIEKIRRQLKGITAPTWQEIWDEMLAVQSVGKEKTTVWTYRTSWKHGISFFWADKTTLEATDSNIEKYKEAYLEEHPARVYDKTGVHLGVLFRYALKKGYIKKLPDLSVLDDLDDIIKKNKRWQKPGRVYTADEIRALTEACEGISSAGKVGGTTRAHKALLASRAKTGILLGLVGLRKGEALALLWEKIDIPNKMMKVWSFKNSKWRDVPMTDDLAESLKVQLKFTAHSKFVFPMPSDPEKHLSPQNFDKVWIKAKQDAKLKDWNVEDRSRFHDLRHTFATLTAELGWPPKVACDVLDMSLEMYDTIYAKPGSAKKSEWMEKTYASVRK